MTSPTTSSPRAGCATHDVIEEALRGALRSIVTASNSEFGKEDGSRMGQSMFSRALAHETFAQP